MTLPDIEEYSLRSIATLGCNIYSQMTVAHVTLPKAVLSKVKIFAVYQRRDRQSLNIYIYLTKTELSTLTCCIFDTP